MVKSIDNESIPGIITIKSDKPGPHLMIQAGIHGDEICGVEAVRDLVTYFKDSCNKLLRGSITLIFANPKAIENNLRCIDHDMNRLFLPDEEVSEDLRSTLEYQRARLIMNFMAENIPDAFLDLHSTSSECDPFCITFSKESENMGLINQLPVKYWVHSWKRNINGVASKFVDDLGATGLVVECGDNSSEESTVVARRAIACFLNYYGLAHFPLDYEHFVTKELRVVHGEKIEDHASFRFLDPDIHNFSEIEPDTMIAVDDSKQYIAPLKIDGKKVHSNFRILLRASEESVRQGQEDAYYLALAEGEGFEPPRPLRA